MSVESARPRINASMLPKYQGKSVTLLGLVQKVICFVLYYRLIFYLHGVVKVDWINMRKVGRQ